MYNIAMNLVGIGVGCMLIALAFIVVVFGIILLLEVI